MATKGFLGAFPGGTTTGNQSIGAVSLNASGKGFPQSYPAGLTTSLFNIGAGQESPQVQINISGAITEHKDTVSSALVETFSASGAITEKKDTVTSAFVQSLS